LLPAASVGRGRRRLLNRVRVIHTLLRLEGNLYTTRLEVPDLSYTGWHMVKPTCRIVDAAKEVEKTCGTYEGASAGDPGEAEALAAAGD